MMVLTFMEKSIINLTEYIDYKFQGYDVKN